MKIFMLILLSLPGIVLHAQDTRPSSVTKGQKESTGVTSRTDPFLQSIAVSDSGVQRLMLWIDDWDKALNGDQPVEASNLNQSKSNVNRVAGAPIITSRSNIKQLQVALDDLKNTDPVNRKVKLEEVQKALTDLETPIRELHNSILAMGERYAGKAAELKTRHDTVKHAIGNIRG